MKKFNFFIIVLLVLGFVNFVSANFSDISNYQYKTSIENLKNLGVVEGYADGTYKPDQQINRAEFLKIVIESLDEDIDFSDYSNCFPDVKNEWFAKYVCYAKENGHVQGYLDGFYKPHHNINYVEALKIIYEANGNSGRESPIPTRRDWYGKYLEDAQGKRIALQELEPGSLLTRGEMAELMVRFTEKIDTPRDAECSLSYNCEGTLIPIAEADFDTCRVLPDCHFAVDKDRAYRRLVDPGSGTIYNYAIIEGVDAATFEDLGFFYFKDRNGVYKDTGWYAIEVPNIDQGSVQALSTHFIKDANHAYHLTFHQGSDPYGSLPFEGSDTVEVEILDTVDTASFEVLQNEENHEQYFKDKNNVYFNEFAFEVLDGVDLDSFELLNSYYYAKDKNNVYFKKETIEKLDADTFEIMDYDLAKDKNNVYILRWDDQKIAEGIDPNTFEVIKHPYYKDKNHVFFDSYGEFTLITYADPAALQVLGYHYARDNNSVFVGTRKIENADPDSFVIVGEGLSKDKNNVYYEGYKIIDGDPDSLEILSSAYFKDKNQVHYKFFSSVTGGEVIKKLENTDPSTFVSLDEYHYAKDKNNVYYDGEKIEYADSETFEVMGFGLAKDKNHTYKDGNIADEE